MRYLDGATSRIHAGLPIFRLDDGDEVLLYAPGHPVATTAASARDVEAVLSGDIDVSMEAHTLARLLEHHARNVVRHWQEVNDAPFQPECLTLYLSNQCNLACTYCYARPDDDVRARLRSGARRATSTSHEFPVLSEAAIAAAARLVAGHCSAAGKPLTLVLHGGGEPTLHWELLVRVWNACAAAADAAGVRLWSYIATHGVITEARARWLARHFDVIGLSCDGPPEIQNANRPTAARAATSAIVERTARLLSDAGAEYIVRATVTPAAASRQVDIVNYLCDRLFARTIRIEPAYDARRTPRQFQPDDALAFVSHFLDACDAAFARGCDLQLSGVRIDEIHGPYCNSLRQVLQLTPDGTASACFLSVGNDPDHDRPLAMGFFDATAGEYVVDRARIAAERARAARIPDECAACHNAYHCARDCPDACALAFDVAPARERGFRCRVQALIGRHQIWQSASVANAISGTRTFG